MMHVKKGSTDISVYVNFVDSAAGTPETGLTITNIDATYTRALAAAVKNDLTALAAVTTAHTDNKGIEIDATNAPGLYRIDFPDAAFATGVPWVILSATCSGCAPVHIFCQLEAVPADITHINGTTASATSGSIDANITKINGVTITGSGVAGDSFEP